MAHLNAGASAWVPKAAAPKAGPPGSEPLNSAPAKPPLRKMVPPTPQPLSAAQKELNAGARVFVPKGAAPPPPPPPPGSGPSTPNRSDVPPMPSNAGMPAPPPPPGPPPPGSPVRPNGPAPPSYQQSAGKIINHQDPTSLAVVADNSKLSARAAPFSPGSTPNTQSPTKSFDNVLNGAPVPPSHPETPTTEGEVRKLSVTEDSTATNGAAGEGEEELSIDTKKEPINAFVDSKLPVPEIPNEEENPPPQLNGSWTLHVDEHAIQIGAAPGAVQAFHDPVVIASVNSIDNFWRLWRHVPPPSTRVPSFTYYWFRKEVKPNWEDARNKNGGTINITLYDRDKLGLQDKSMMNDAWTTAVMCASGESLNEAASINGVSLKIRNRFTMMQIWTNCATKKELSAIVDSLRKELKPYCTKESLAEGKLDFFTHQQVIKSIAPAPKPKKGKAAPKATSREPDFQF